MVQNYEKSPKNCSEMEDDVYQNIQCSDQGKIEFLSSSIYSWFVARDFYEKVFKHTVKVGD